MAVALIIIGVILLGVTVYFGLVMYKRDYGDASERVKKLQTDKYSSNMGKLAARNQQGKAEARTDLAVQIGKESRAVADMVVQQTEVIEKEFIQDNTIAKKREERLLEQAKLDNELTLIDAAQKESLDPSTYQQIRMMQATAEIDLRKKEREIELEVRLKRELKQIELEAEHVLAGLDTQMAEIKLLLPHHEANVLNTQLSNLSFQLEQAHQLPDSEHKEREIKRINRQMRAWGKEVRDRQKRLS